MFTRPSRTVLWYRNVIKTERLIWGRLHSVPFHLGWDAGLLSLYLFYSILYIEEKDLKTFSVSIGKVHVLCTSLVRRSKTTPERTESTGPDNGPRLGSSSLPFLPSTPPKHQPTFHPEFCSYRNGKSKRWPRRNARSINSRLRCLLVKFPIASMNSDPYKFYL